MRGSAQVRVALFSLVLMWSTAPLLADEVDDAIGAAWVTYQGGDVQGAIAAFESIKTRHPDDVRPNGKLAFLLLTSDGELGRIFDLLVQRLEVQRGDEWTLRTVATVGDRALAVGLPELARNCAKLLMAAEPTEKQHQYLFARASYRQGRLNSVAEICRGLIDDYPSWELPYWLLARTLSDQGKLEEAVQIYRELLKELPGNVDARMRMARAQLNQRNYDAAEDSYRSALELAEQGSYQREMAQGGISIVRSERALTTRLRKQNAFLDRLLMLVAAGWAAVVLALVFVTRRKR